MKTQVTLAALLTGLVLATGCSQESSTTTTDGATATAIDGSRFLLTAEPAESATVIEAREQTKDGEDVVLVGRIGGSANPWVEGRAAFTVVDPTLKACSDIPGDECKIPWDYCCETHKLPGATALVTFAGDDGRPLKADARDLLSLKELQTVIVRGKAERDEAGNLTVLATGLFVRESKQPVISETANIPANDASE